MDIVADPPPAIRPRVQVTVWSETPQVAPGIDAVSTVRPSGTTSDTT
jgi:hypothetical protein